MTMPKQQRVQTELDMQRQSVQKFLLVVLDVIDGAAKQVHIHPFD